MRKAIPNILLLALVFLLSCPVLAYADGQGNMDGGGSGMGQGTTQNFWSPGNDGVRITVVHAETGEAAAPPEDFSNKTFSKPIIHFEKRSKLDYRAGAALTPATGELPLSYTGRHHSLHYDKQLTPGQYPGHTTVFLFRVCRPAGIRCNRRGV